MSSENHPEKGKVLKDLTLMLNRVARLEVADGNGGVFGSLSGICYQNLPEGLEITGNGTLQHPMDVTMSPVYKAAPDLLKALKLAANFIENVTDDDPQRQDKFFEAREAWNAAIAKATK